MSFSSLSQRLVGTVCLALGLAVAVAVSGPATAQDAPKAEPPVFVTSVGQSLDAFQVQLLLRRAQVPYEYDPLAGVDALGDAKTLFLVVGASLKGFGEAGISIEDEVARTTELINEAEARGMTIIVLHTGGVERRDDLSNRLIDLTAPHADAIYIRNDSDADGRFAAIAAEHNIPLTSVDGLVALLPPVQALFADSAGL